MSLGDAIYGATTRANQPCAGKHGPCNGPIRTVHTRVWGALSVCLAHERPLRDAGEIVDRRSLVRITVSPLPALQQASATVGAQADGAVPEPRGSAGPVDPAESVKSGLQDRPSTPTSRAVRSGASPSATLEIPMARPLVLRDPLIPGKCRIDGCDQPIRARDLCARDHSAARDAKRLEELGAPSKNRGPRSTYIERAAEPHAPAVDIEQDPTVIALRARVAHLETAHDALLADQDILAQISETIDGGEAAWPSLPGLVAWVSERATIRYAAMETRVTAGEKEAAEIRAALGLSADVDGSEVIREIERRGDDGWYVAVAQALDFDPCDDGAPQSPNEAEQAIRDLRKLWDARPFGGAVPASPRPSIALYCLLDEAGRHGIGGHIDPFDEHHDRALRSWLEGGEVAPAGAPEDYRQMLDYLRLATLAAGERLQADVELPADDRERYDDAELARDRLLGLLTVAYYVVGGFQEWPGNGGIVASARGVA